MIKTEKMLGTTFLLFCLFDILYLCADVLNQLLQRNTLGSSVLVKFYLKLRYWDVGRPNPHTLNPHFYCHFEDQPCFLSLLPCQRGNNRRESLPRLEAQTLLTSGYHTLGTTLRDLESCTIQLPAASDRKARLEMEAKTM